ncbi:hypothetical protein [Angustibacter luteus]|uniref:SAF domain-containing protein n=1 Tax=Angustibacter luteus TaxID=658456 RepID=A0ABW1JL04_9ACTN
MAHWLDRLAGHVRLPQFMARPVPGAPPSRRLLWLRRSLVPAALTLLVVALAGSTVAVIRYDRPPQLGSPGRVTADLRPTPEEAIAPAASGILVSATLKGDGTIDVVERLHLREPRDVVVLGVQRPAATQDPTSAPEQVPQALGVTLTADGRPVTAPRRVTTEPSFVALTSPSTELVLRYQLVGTTVRSRQSVPGRALTTLAPIGAATEDGLGLTVQLTPQGSTILNLVCPDLSGARAATCATETAGRWRTTTPLSAAPGVTLAQVDLDQ